MPRPNMDLVRMHVRIRRVDAEDLAAYYPSFGARTTILRALVARHVRKLNEKVGRKVSLAPDEAEAHLISEEVNHVTGTEASPDSADKPDGSG